MKISQLVKVWVGVGFLICISVTGGLASEVNASLEANLESQSNPMSEILLNLAKEELNSQYLVKTINDTIGSFVHTPAEALQIKLELEDYGYDRVQKIQAEILELEQKKKNSVSEYLHFTQMVPQAVGASWLPTRQLSLLKDRIHENKNYPIQFQETLAIESLDQFAIKNGLLVDYPVENENYQYSLRLQNMIPTPPGRYQHGAPVSALVMLARIECSEPLTIRRTFARDYENVRVQEFPLYSSDMNAQKVYLDFPQKNIQCELRLKFRGEEQYTAGLRIHTNDVLNSERLSGGVREACLFDPAAPKTDALSLMANAHYRGMSCEMSADDAKLYDDPYEAFNAKVEALAGSRLPDEVFKTKNFQYPIDFSKAPHFDILYITTLEYKVDFTGKILEQIIKWHADRGTQVRIVIPGMTAIAFPQEKKFLLEMARYNPNIRVQFYKFKKKGEGINNLHTLHRVTHAKLIIGISSADPSKSFVVTGGRNIKDTFLFQDKPDYSAFEGMSEYGSRREPFIYYHDLEILVRGDAVAKQAAAQTMSFWHRDSNSMIMRPASVHLGALSLSQDQRQSLNDSLRSQLRLRHMISLPFSDDRELEVVFADLIQSASKRLRIVSPYFRPMPKIAKAIEDALSRGVRIEFTTRMDLAGDNTPSITGDVNKKTANEYYDRFEIYGWSANSILHSKAVLVDDEVLFIGGTNLNIRSFTHDVESGFLLTSPSIIQEFNRIYDQVYLRHSDRVVGPQKLKWISKVLIPVVGGFF